MTKKDYIKIAKAISESTSNSKDDEFVSKPYLVDELCTIFKEDNPNFDRARFVNASTDNS